MCSNGAVQLLPGARRAGGLDASQRTTKRPRFAALSRENHLSISGLLEDHLSAFFPLLWIPEPFRAVVRIHLGGQQAQCKGCHQMLVSPGRTFRNISDLYQSHAVCKYAGRAAHTYTRGCSTSSADAPWIFRRNSILMACLMAQEGLKPAGVKFSKSWGASGMWQHYPLGMSRHQKRAAPSAHFHRRQPEVHPSTQQSKSVHCSSRREFLHFSVLGPTYLVQPRL